jgi:hypothetical protein
MDIYNHSTQRPSISSFVISAKSKTIPNTKLIQQPTASLNTDIISQNKSSLLNELKSLIPVLGETQNRNKNENTVSSIPQPPPPPPPPPPPTMLLSSSSLTRQPLLIPTSPPPMTTFLPSKVAKAAASSTAVNVNGVQDNLKSPPPAVAPKNFSNNDLNKKKQVLLNNRNNLMDSIKGFDISNLKKISTQNE